MAKNIPHRLLNNAQIKIETLFLLCILNQTRESSFIKRNFIGHVQLLGETQCGVNKSQILLSKEHYGGMKFQIPLVTSDRKLPDPSPYTT